MNEPIKRQHRLEFERNITVPAPLDPHIASVSLRSGANDPTDSFDLMLSATFGTEWVTIQSGDDTIEVKISIKKAEIRLDGVQCSLTTISDQTKLGEGWLGSEKRVQMHSHSTSGNVAAETELRFGANSLGSIAASAKGSFSQNREISQSKETIRKNLPYRVLNNQHVQISTLEGDSGVLNGSIIDENVLIRVTPNDGADQAGVLARIRVRERWILIEDAKPVASKAPLSRALSVFSPKSDEDRRQRDLFAKLISHLVKVNLQEKEDSTNATLAAAAAVLVQEKNIFENISSYGDQRVIKVDPTIIENFISSPQGQQVNYLKSVGVEFDDPVEEASIDTLEQWSLEDAFNFALKSSSRFGARPLEKEHLSGFMKAISGSFGMEVDYTVSQERDHFFSQIEFKLIRVSKDHISAKNLIGKYAHAIGGYDVFGDLVAWGILVKGETAFRLATLFDFPYSYQTLIKRMKPYSFQSSYGWLITIHDLLVAIGEIDNLHLLEGITLSKITLLDFPVADTSDN